VLVLPVPVAFVARIATLLTLVCVIHPLGDFLNPALALLGQGLKKSPSGQKLDFANPPYLRKCLKIF
jgi:hypothetical protein